MRARWVGRAIGSDLSAQEWGLARVLRWLSSRRQVDGRGHRGWAAGARAGSARSVLRWAICKHEMSCVCCPLCALGWFRLPGRLRVDIEPLQRCRAGADDAWQLTHKLQRRAG